jgi:hypothetical protein
MFSDVSWNRTKIDCFITLISDQSRSSLQYALSFLDNLQLMRDNGVAGYVSFWALSLSDVSDSNRAKATDF